MQELDNPQNNKLIHTILKQKFYLTGKTVAPRAVTYDCISIQSLSHDKYVSITRKKIVRLHSIDAASFANHFVVLIFLINYWAV